MQRRLSRPVCTLALIAGFTACAGTAQAQASNCTLSADAWVYGWSGASGYTNRQTIPATSGVPQITAAAAGASNLCSAASSCSAVAEYGHAAIAGNGAGSNCSQGDATIYTYPNVRTRDVLVITSSTMPNGTRVPVRVQLTFSTACTSVHSALPYCGAYVDLDVGGDYGPLRFTHIGQTGVYEGITDMGIVGSYLSLDTYLTGHSGASALTFGPPIGPAESISCSVGAEMSFTIEPLIANVTLTSCSGHNYAPPVVCDSIDFNGDSLFPDTADIDDFLTVFSGGACSTGSCGDIDFNNDGLFPDTADIDSLLSVFSGGPCL